MLITVNVDLSQIFALLNMSNSDCLCLIHGDFESVKAV
ncbi:hypothetical protein SPWS13_4613 [Shewanella putrefaciens]|nr:hypothetical protein SPWS13_4613 [Shewanella putrefaciens]